MINGRNKLGVKSVCKLWFLIFSFVCIENNSFLFLSSDEFYVIFFTVKFFTVDFYKNNNRLEGDDDLSGIEVANDKQQHEEEKRSRIKDENIWSCCK